jgi:2-polyprenyl-3-methyl-5-hydroxy-6-metoxy-1,4-benzoquinol methylase
VSNLQDQQIKTRPVTNCCVCGALGNLLYEGFRDRGFSAPGVWNQRKCPKPDCGLVWLDPVPTEEDIAKIYETYYTHNQPTPLAGLVSNACWGVWKSYLRHRFGYTRGTGPAWTSLLWPLALIHPGGRAELDAGAMYLPAPAQPSRLLDVGCGAGVALKRMLDMGWEARGQEIDPKAVQAAEARGVRVDLGTLNEQKYPAAHFDAVHMAHVIEHVHDPAGLLRESYRVLKPGGVLVVLTPNVESWGHARFGKCWLNLDPPRHLVLFSRKTLGKLAEREGFKVQRLETSVRTCWVYGSMSRQVQRTGRANLADLGKPSVLMHGVIYQLRERLALRGDPDAGDELLLIARK